ncbi:hypothetical protein FRC02_007820 [Tulasnella sp. 418]|nr:hypothetical protein FRC02_007820 [Tulasnella sp. 418]
MLQHLYPHLKRWRSLSLEVWEQEPADILTSALIDEAPRLESVILTGYSSKPINLFGGVTPRLQRLSIKTMSLDWKSSLFSTVTDLYVHCSTFNSPSLLGDWQCLRKLTIRADPTSPLQFDFEQPTIVLPDLEVLELNGVSEEDIVSILSFVEMPNLRRLLFTHIKDSVNVVFHSIFPLPRLRELRLHATEMCQDNLLRVLNKVRNLETISFEDSSPIPSFIEALTATDDSKNWVIPDVQKFKVIAFEKDNAHRVYDDSDIYTALAEMWLKRMTYRKETDLHIQMCIFEGERNEITRHATEWDVERPYMSVRDVYP